MGDDGCVFVDGGGRWEEGGWEAGFIQRFRMHKKRV